MRLLLLLQGAYYLLTGLWPLVHMPSFELVTGPKVDDWLVQTVGALTVAIGVALLAGAQRDVGRESVVLSATSAVAFAAIDLTYGLSGRIRPVYLGDGAIEIALVLGVLLLAARARARYLART